MIRIRQRAVLRRPATRPRPATALVVSSLALAGLVAGCESSAPSSDDSPPTLGLRWFKARDGQAFVKPGETATISSADVSTEHSVNLDADDEQGVKRLDVTWSGSGRCDTNPSSSGQTFTSPSALSFNFAPISKVARAGSVFTKSTTADLNEQLTKAINDGISCGVHRYANMPGPEEFFWSMGPGTLTVRAHAENCCGGGVDGTFTIKVP